MYNTYTIYMRVNKEHDMFTATFSELLNVNASKNMYAR